MWTSPAQVLACLRAACLLSSETVVVDVSSVSPDERPAKATWQDIESLARDAAGRLFAGTDWPRLAVKARRTLLAASLLALTVFNRRWLLRAVESSVEPGVKSPIRYLTGCLRMNCFEVCSIGDRVEDVSESWFGAVMQCAEHGVDLYRPVPPCAIADPEPPKAAIAAATPEELATAKAVDIKAALRKQRAEAIATLTPEP